MRALLTGLLLSAGLILPIDAGAAVAADAGTKPLPALYTQADAALGQRLYAENCASCHGADLRGKIGPAIIGPTIGSAANHTTVAIMFNVIAGEMPAGAPASLPMPTYLAVMAYLLQQNGYPAGAQPLTHAAVEAADVPLISQVP